MKKNNNAINLFTCGCASLFLLAANLVAGENLVLNGNFTDGIEGWGFRWNTSTGIPDTNHPEQLEVVDPTGGGASLRITFPEVPDTERLWSHSSGALAQLSYAIPAGSKILVKLKARAISGASCLTINRASGGANSAVAQLDSDWMTIEAKIDTSFDAPSVIFSLTDKIPQSDDMEQVADGTYSLSPKNSQLAVREGVVEIKDVSVEEVPAE